MCPWVTSTISIGWTITHKWLQDLYLYLPILLKVPGYYTFNCCLDIPTWNTPTHLKFNMLQTKLIMSSSSLTFLHLLLFLFPFSPWLESWGHLTACPPFMMLLHSKMLFLSRIILIPGPERLLFTEDLAEVFSLLWRLTDPLDFHNPRTSGVALSIQLKVLL